MVRKAFKIVAAGAIAAGLLSGCGGNEKEAGTAKTESVAVILDWTPNTNHAGLYVALEKGFYSAEGLNVDIIQPSEGATATLIAAGKVYGGWGSPSEEAVLKAVMENNGADFGKLQRVDIGSDDFFAATSKNIDFAWIFIGKRFD
ncbi:ABC transporter substrate-binding protein [Paenibacillus sp. CAU 1782]